jgi:hypothetical protein
LLAPYHNIVWGNINYGSNTAIRTWIGQYFLWQTLQTDSSLAAASPVLSQFQSMAASSRFAYMSNIETDIANRDFTSALSLLSTCPTAMPQYDPVTGVIVADSIGATHIVANYMKFYKILIHYLDSTISNEEKDTLKALANRCPITEGTVVYQARSLYAMVFNTVAAFSDDVCNPPADGGKHASTNNIPLIKSSQQPLNLLIQSQQYTLSPNPNNGIMTLIQMLSDNNHVRVVVLNMLGQQVYSDELLFREGKAQLNMQGNAPGLYVLQLTDCKGNSFICKFVISN